MSKVAEPRSKTPPPTEERRSARRAPRPGARRPPAEAEVQNSRSRSVLSLSAIGLEARQPSPRSATNLVPLLISTTAALDVAHRRRAVAERRRARRRARRLEPGHRRPGPVDRVDDEHPVRRRRPGRPSPVLRVEGDTGRARGQEALEERLGLGVDREGDVAADAARTWARPACEPRCGSTSSRRASASSAASLSPALLRGGFSAARRASSSTVALLAAAVDLDLDLLARARTAAQPRTVVRVADRPSPRLVTTSPPFAHERAWNRISPAAAHARLRRPGRRAGPPARHAPSSTGRPKRSASCG